MSVPTCLSLSSSAFLSDFSWLRITSAFPRPSSPFSAQFSSVAQPCPTLRDLMDRARHARPPCPSPTLGLDSNSCPSSRWCHPAIASFVVPFSRLQSFPASRSFPMSQLFASGGRSTGTSPSTSVLPMNIQGLFPLGWTDLISLLSVGHSRVFLLL